MSRIRSAGNRDTELRLIAIFRAQRIVGWRRQQTIRFNFQPSTSNPERSKLSVGRRAFSFRVRPDFVFRARKLTVFVDGCFWHGCPRHFSQPRNNAAFWRKKIAANRTRDRLVTRTLRQLGWKVVRVWEHELVRRNEPRLIRRLSELAPISVH